MKEISFGPVRNPDGSPSDLTKEMLAGTGRDPDEFVGRTHTACATCYESAAWHRRRAAWYRDNIGPQAELDFEWAHPEPEDD